MDIKKLLGQKIKNIRKEKGYTQEKFSEMINISQRTLSGIESGKNFLTAPTLNKIMEVFEITPDEIFKLNHLKDSSEIRKELIVDIKTLPDEKLKMAYSIIEAIKTI